MIAKKCEVLEEVPARMLDWAWKRWTWRQWTHWRLKTLIKLTGRLWPDFPPYILCCSWECCRIFCYHHSMRSEQWQWRKVGSLTSASRPITFPLPLLDEIGASMAVTNERTEWGGHTANITYSHVSAAGFVKGGPMWGPQLLSVLIWKEAAPIIRGRAGTSLWAVTVCIFGPPASAYVSETLHQHRLQIHRGKSMVDDLTWEGRGFWSTKEYKKMAERAMKLKGHALTTTWMFWRQKGAILRVGGGWHEGNLSQKPE